SRRRRIGARETSSERVPVADRREFLVETGTGAPADESKNRRRDLPAKRIIKNRSERKHDRPGCLEYCDRPRTPIPPVLHGFRGADQRGERQTGFYGICPG